MTDFAEVARAAASAMRQFRAAWEKAYEADPAVQQRRKWAAQLRRGGGTR
jgi:hypothetical protein